MNKSTFAGLFLIPTFLGCHVTAQNTIAIENGLGLTYSVKQAGADPEYRTLNAKFTTLGASQAHVTFEPAPASVAHVLDFRKPAGVGLKDMPTEVHRLPIWIPPDWRNVGQPIFDGNPILTETTWRKFKALLLIARSGESQMKAYYDKESGFLVSAILFDPKIDKKSTWFEWNMNGSTDRDLQAKAAPPVEKVMRSLVVSRDRVHVGTVRFDASNRPTLALEGTGPAVNQISIDWNEISIRPELTWKYCERDGDEHRMMGKTVRPGDPGYIYGAMDALERAGYSVDLAE